MITVCQDPMATNYTGHDIVSDRSWLINDVPVAATTIDIVTASIAVTTATVVAVEQISF